MKDKDKPKTDKKPVGEIVDTKTGKDIPVVRRDGESAETAVDRTQEKHQK